MKIIRHGDTPRLNGVVRHHCRCGCVTSFDKHDDDYIEYVTNVCGEYHKTNDIHVNAIRITCPECGHVSVIKLNDVRGRRAYPYVVGMIAKILGIMTTISPILNDVSNSQFFGMLVCSSIVIGTAIFIAGKYLCDINNDVVFDVCERSKTDEV